MVFCSPQHFYDAQPIELRQHPIDDEGIIFSAGSKSQPVFAIFGMMNHVAIFTEPPLDEIRRS